MPDISMKRLVSVLLICLLIIVSVIFIRRLQGPAVGSISSVNNIADTKVKILHFTGKYVSFDYQSDLKQQVDNKPQPNVLESYIFNKPADGRTAAAYLAITVYNLPSGKSDNNSAYSYRKNNPQLYSSRTLAINGYNVVVMTKLDTKEVTAFSLNGKMLAAISLTAAQATSNELENRFDAVLNSWQWK